MPAVDFALEQQHLQATITIILLQTKAVISAESKTGNQTGLALTESPDKLYFANQYFQIIQLTAHCHHKLL